MGKFGVKRVTLKIRITFATTFVRRTTLLNMVNVDLTVQGLLFPAINITPSLPALPLNTHPHKETWICPNIDYNRKNLFFWSLAATQATSNPSLLWTASRKTAGAKFTIKESF